jgi:hypothetical protein
MTSRGFQQPTTVIIKNYTSNAAGIASFVCGFISIFFLAPIFVPLAILLAVIAIATRQFVWGIVGLVCAFVGFITSPILMGIFGISTAAAIIHNSSSQSATISQHQTEHLLSPIEQQRQNFIALTNNLIPKIQEADTQIDATLENIPRGEAHYHAITAKVRAYYGKAQSLSGERYSVPRNQIIVAMNQGTVATNQVNVTAQSVQTNFTSHVQPLLNELAQAEHNCPASDTTINQACQKLHDTGEVFKNKCRDLSTALQGLENTYQAELAAQQAMIDKAEQIQ